MKVNAKWFRWKGGSMLYIPHGSDERCCWWCYFFRVDFALYPTWFRWKVNIKDIPIYNMKQLYIPHGSDERSVFSFESASCFCTLYPTWFRWKRSATESWASAVLSFISHMVQMKVVWKQNSLFLQGLYIPHGSDESSISLGEMGFVFKLYIPHGSDERVPPSAKSL